MGKFLKDETAKRMHQSISFTESFPQGKQPRNRRVIRSVGGGISLFDCVITNNFDDEPDRYIVSVYKNFDGRSFQTDPEDPIEDQTMIIKDARGKPLQTGVIVKCQAFSENHDEPIGSPPDPQTDPPTVSPFSVTVYRPTNLAWWR